MDSGKKVLITGSNGFVASHLIPALKKEGFGEIYGLSLENNSGLIEKENYSQADISNPKQMQEIIGKVQPDIIFHLAAILKGTAKIPVKTMEVNFNGTLNLLEAIRLNEIDSVFHFSGSCLEYGKVKESKLPVKEETIFQPYNLYGASKAAAELITQQYNKSYGIKTIITRAFHHLGPGEKGEALVCNEWSKKIALIESGELAELKIGNPELARDFLDVRDIVQAYSLAVKKCDFGKPYNICSGKPTKLGEILEILKSMTEKEISVKENCFGGNSEPLSLYGDNTLFVEKTNWKQSIPLEQSLCDTLEFWRKKIKHS